MRTTRLAETVKEPDCIRTAADARDQQSGNRPSLSGFAGVLHRQSR